MKKEPAQALVNAKDIHHAGTMPAHALTLALRARWLAWTRFRPQAWRFPRYSAPVRRWLVLHSGPNPSTDYYILSRAQQQDLEVQVCDIGCDMPTAVADWEDTQVIVVRYLNRRWADALLVQRERLAGVVYFMDDDLLDKTAWHDLPKSYRTALTLRMAEGEQAIAELSSDVWVATPALAGRYGHLRPRVVPPLPLPEDLDRLRSNPVKPGEPLHFFYHGTSAHEAEMRWLQPIVADVLAAVPNAHFEMVGPHEVNRLYRNLPRTTVLHPMSWPNYLAYCRSRPAHVGLAPLLQSRFNESRSHVKKMDIARRGAVGIYSDAPSYRSFIRHEIDGFLVCSEKNAWKDMIIKLLSDTIFLNRSIKNITARAR